MEKRLIKIFLCAVMLCMMIPIVAFAEPSGDWSDNAGTLPSPVENIYVISNAGEFAAVAKAVNEGTNNFEGKIVKLSEDIDLSAHYWIPVGDYDNKFQGTFDGNGKTVSGMKVNEGNLYAGLFGYIKKGEIKNVTVSGLVAGTDSGEDDIYYGGIVGYSINSIIDHCCFTGEVSGTATSRGDVCAGGISGYNSNGTISYCNSNGTVTGKSIIDGDDVYSGGLVGYNNSLSVISNSYSTAAVEGNSVDGSVYSGGLVGENCRGDKYGDTILQNCYATGSVTSTAGSSENSWAGGLVGCNDYQTSILNCYATGEVTANGGDADKYVGGIIGFNDNESSTKRLPNIDNCYCVGRASVNPVGNMNEEECATKTEAEMKSAAFVSLLNNWIDKEDEAMEYANCYWKGEDGSYPVFDTEKEVIGYDVWLGNVRVLSTNCNDITAAINKKQTGSATGEAKYIPATKTEPAKLQLNNFTFNGKGYKRSWSDTYKKYDYFYGLYFKGDLNIELIGESTISEVSTEFEKNRSSCGICNIYNEEPLSYEEPKILTFSGTGKLTAKAGDCINKNSERKNITAGINIKGNLALKDTVSVTGIGGNSTAGTDVQSYDAYSTGIECGQITSESGTTCIGIGGNISLTDNVEDNQASFSLEGGSVGIRAYLKSIAGDINGKGGNITLNSNNEGNQGKYMSANSFGIVSSGIFAITDIPHITGSLTAVGGETSSTYNNDYRKAESYGIGRWEYGNLNIAADSFVARGNTAALYGGSSYKACYDNYQIILMNTENSPTGNSVTDGMIMNSMISTHDNSLNPYKYIQISASYSVNISYSGNMTRKSDSGSYSQMVSKGSSITDVIYTADEGYYFPENYSVSAVNGISVTRNSESQITVSGTPTGSTNIYLTAPAVKTKEEKPSSGGGGGGDTTYPVTVSDKVENAVVKVSASNSSKNDTVTVTVTPDNGYKIEKIVVTDKKGKEITVTDNGNNTYSFKMPASEVKVEPVIVKDDSTQNIIKFVDVADNAYFAKPVYWAAENNVTKGIDNTHFGPDRTCTRGQIVTFLWRISGSPEPESSSCPFTDIKESDYCYKAVLWAVEKGITKGMDATHFGADLTVSRAQSVTFLFRNAGNEITSENENQFTDISSKDYFYDAVKWAASTGVANGTSKDKFSPNDDCTRAQIVTFLYRHYVK